MFRSASIPKNTDKQRQIDKLKVELEAVQAKQQSAEKRLQQQEQQAEEDAHRMRVEFCKQLAAIANTTTNCWDTTAVEANYRVPCALLRSSLEQKDKERFGAAKASEMWEKARKQAEQEVKAEKFEWAS